MTDADVGRENDGIAAAAPDDLGLVQVYWGDGKGKTTAALGAALRATGHGYRVHVLQFMKGGADTVEDVRGEHRAMAALPGVSYEHAGHYGWHGRSDGTDDADHAAEARAALERARELLAAARGAALHEPIPLDASPERGVHVLVLDEVLYAANRGLVAPEDLVAAVEAKPDDLELLLTGGHERPTYIEDHADLVTEVAKHRHPMDDGVGARRGTEY